MNSIEKLLLENKAWAQSMVQDDPDFFMRLSRIQTPEFLWIGCSDSRVPANEITNTDPGEIFVHRNIANMVVHTDLNLLSVLEYSVNVLKVKHIIVCGHYGCGGVNAALTRQSLGVINKWLRNIKDVYRLHQEEIDAIPDPEQRSDRMVELNVTEQVLNLSKTSIIQRAWKSDNRPSIHGWVYGLKNGIIKQVFQVNSQEDIDPIYRFQFED
ncbi:MAG: carbonate dehydratase [Cytophagales bacterium]|nr:carbonate dehydratase [Cytophagales bacterium]